MGQKTDDLIKKYGELAFVGGENFIDQQNQDIISVSPAIDLIIGGGIPSGSFVNLAGKEKVGKTVTALTFARNAQKLGYKIYYLNIEGRLKKRDLLGIDGLDTSVEKFEIIGSYRDRDTGEIKILNAEDYLNIGEHKLKTETKIVLIFDSVSQLASSKEYSKAVGEAGRPEGPTLMSQFCRHMSNVVPINDSIVISILHIVANTGNMGGANHVTGGNKIKFACDVGLTGRRIGYIEGKGGMPLGQEVEWKTFSTALNAAPNQKITSTITYGIGVDEANELVTLGLDMGFIQSAGSWYKVDNKKLVDEEVKMQGKDKMCKFFRENPDKLTKLNTMIKEVMGMV
jgi:recombination protein RecA